MKKVMCIVSMGDFTVNLQERRVFAADTELAVEPKVVDVLCYLIEHNSRYVSLAELHDNVWAGRVVTDTAVRRTISKLRILLNDTDAENPQYIKSQMKRGYQLICNVTTEDPAPAAQMTERPESIRGYAEQPLLFRKPFSIGLAITALLLVAFYYWYSPSGPQPVNQMVEIETLLSIPGQKTSLSVSKDGRWQAFVAKVDDSRSWELFLYDSSVGQLQKIATPDGDSRFVSFIANDTKLAYIVYQGEQAYLYTQLLSNLNEPPLLLPTTGYPFLFEPLPLTEHKLLIAASKELTGNVHYYKYDMLQHHFEQFTYSDKYNIQDVFASISPDRKSVALGRADIGGRKVDLQLYRLADKELLAEYLIHDGLFDLHLTWLDNATLLIRSNLEHQLLRITDGARLPIATMPHPLHEFHLSANGELIALDKQIHNRKTFQVAWPFKDQFDKNFQFGPEVTAVWFSQDSEYLWLRTHEDNENRLYRYYPADNKRHLVFASTKYLFISDQSADGKLLLLKHANRYEIYNTATAQTVAVTIATQNVYSASFTLDEQVVIFSEKVQTRWQIKQFDLITKKQTVLLPGYQYLAESANGYVGATPDGEVWLLDKDFNQRQLLSKVSLTEFSYDLQVRNDQLIVITRDLLGEWIISNINLTTLETWQRRIAFHDFSLTYSIDSNAENLIFMTLKKEENQLVKYSYDFAGK
ncbi:winged helix-turn-helix domain-containing protein [Arsukibacterium ikkense]|uniref:winged helix-turn-helix domain-containing protein n=1 Tax=Arsukibacterium ikkense TaxID=336831 RepID=UPI00128C0E5E|nr:winged helix-turn-helix domain-containing protein [Arsukibacterium ikkense]